MAITRDELVTHLKATGAAAYKSAMHESADATARVGDSAEHAARQAEAAQRQMNAVANAMISAGMAGVAGFGAMIKVSADFERTLSEIKAMSGATAEQMDELAEATRGVELQELGITAREAAQGLWSFASAGFSVEQQLKALLPTAAAAKALGAEFNAVSALGVAIMGQYELEAEDFEMIMKALVGTYQTSQANLDKLAAAYRQAGVTLGDLNWTVQESAAAFGVLLDAGMRGEQAGTVMRGAMSKLIVPTADAGAALEEAGISADELAHALGNPIELIELFSQHQLTGAQATRIFGMEARNVTVLLHSGADAYREHLEAAGENVDLMETATIQTDNLYGAVERLQAAWEALATSQGEYAANPLRATIEGAAALLRAYNALPGPIQRVITYFGMATTAALLLGGAYLKLRIYQAQMATAAALRAMANVSANATETASVNVLAGAYARLLAVAGGARVAGAALLARIGGTAAVGAGGAIASIAWPYAAAAGVGAAIPYYGTGIGRDLRDVAEKARGGGMKEGGWWSRRWEGVKGALGYETRAQRHIEAQAAKPYAPTPKREATLAESRQLDDSLAMLQGMGLMGEEGGRVRSKAEREMEMAKAVERAVTGGAISPGARAPTITAGVPTAQAIARRRQAEEEKAERERLRRLQETIREEKRLADLRHRTLLQSADDMQRAAEDSVRMQEAMQLVVGGWLGYGISDAIARLSGGGLGEGAAFRGLDVARVPGELVLRVKFDGPVTDEMANSFMNRFVPLVEQAGEETPVY